MEVPHLVYFLYRNSINSSWPWKSHSSKLNPTLLYEPLPIKVVIQVCYPITKNLRVKVTVKCRRIYLNLQNYVIFFIPMSIGILLSYLEYHLLSSLFCFLFSNPATQSFRCRSFLRIRFSLDSISRWSREYVYHYEGACTMQYTQSLGCKIVF